jgi:hypothetical protein
MPLIVDPPSGWMYGFPRPLDQSVPFRSFLKQHGYPESLMTLAEKYSRYWTEENESSDGKRQASDPA